MSGRATRRSDPRPEPGPPGGRHDAAWRRSDAWGASPEPAALREVEPLPPASVELGALVVQDLGALLVDLAPRRIAVLVADAECRVVVVRCADPGLAAFLAGSGVGPGAWLSEERVGTNPIGTAREGLAEVELTGADHFNRALRPLRTAGLPLRSRNGRIVGVLALVQPAEDPGELLLPATRLAGRHLQDRLALAGSRRLLELLEAVRHESVTGAGVLALSDRLAIASRQALQLIEPGDHVAIRAWAASGKGAAGGALRLGSGVSVAPLAGRPDAEPIFTVTPPSVSASRLPGTESPVLIFGEPGSGRSEIARSSVAPGPVRVVDFAEPATRDARLTTALAALADGRCAVILEDVQVLGARPAQQLARAVAASSARVSITSAPRAGTDRSMARFAPVCNSRIYVEPLRRRRHEIPGRAQQMLAEEAPEAGLRLSPEAVQVLTDHAWPGNEAELRLVIRKLVATATGPVIDVAAVVPFCPPTRRRNSLQQAQASAIIDAINANRGNMAQAARVLGISRSTLYNKMKALKIDRRSTTATRSED